MLNKYTKSISTIIFFIENPDMVLHLNSIENGEIKTILLGDKSTAYKVEPKILFNNIEELIQNKFGHFNISDFQKFYNRYITPFFNIYGGHDDDFPLSVEQIISILNLDKTQYNIDSLIQEYLEFVLNYIKVYPLTLEVSNYVLDKFKEQNIIKEEEFTPYIHGVLNVFSEKVVDYKSGKTGLFNLFFGETMKALPNKNVDKVKLRAAIESILNG